MGIHLYYKCKSVTLMSNWWKFGEIVPFGGSPPQPTTLPTVAVACSHKPPLGNALDIFIFQTFEGEGVVHSIDSYLRVSNTHCLCFLRQILSYFQFTMYTWHVHCWEDGCPWEFLMGILTTEGILKGWGNGLYNVHPIRPIFLDPHWGIVLNKTRYTPPLGCEHHIQYIDWVPDWKAKDRNLFALGCSTLWYRRQSTVRRGQPDE